MLFKKLKNTSVITFILGALIFTYSLYKKVNCNDSICYLFKSDNIQYYLFEGLVWGVIFIFISIAPSAISFIRKEKNEK